MTTYNTNKGSRISLIIGAPIGILVLVSLVLFLLDQNQNEDVLFLLFPLFFCSQVLLIAFLLVLWRSGRKATTNLLDGQLMLWVVVKYATTICLVMGSVFSGIALLYWSSVTFLFVIGGIFMFAKLFLPIVFIFAGTFAVSFIIGLLVCNVINWQINRNAASLNGHKIR